VEKTSSVSTGSYGPVVVVDQETVTLRPVTGKGNEEWSKYTPGGELKLYINNPAALEQFVVGKDYYLDFTPCED
jgi:hypothetical protein